MRKIRLIVLAAVCPACRNGISDIAFDRRGACFKTARYFGVKMFRDIVYKRAVFDAKFNSRPYIVAALVVFIYAAASEQMCNIFCYIEVFGISCPYICKDTFIQFLRFGHMLYYFCI